MISLIQGSLIALVLLTSIPLGFFLSRWTSEELFAGKKYFKNIILSCLFLILLFIDLAVFKFVSFDLTLNTVLTIVYFGIITFISLKQAKSI